MPVETALTTHEGMEVVEKENKVLEAIRWAGEQNDKLLTGLDGVAEKTPAILPVIKPLLESLADNGMAARALAGKNLETGEDLEGVDRLKTYLKFKGRGMLNETVAALEIVGFIIPAAELPWAIRAAGAVAKGIKAKDAKKVVKEAPGIFKGMSEKAAKKENGEVLAKVATHFEELTQSPSAVEEMAKGLEEDKRWQKLVDWVGQRDDRQAANDLIAGKAPVSA
ncbi:hypothetical protein ACFL1M_03540 [Patescibacteria group bacterium]